MRDHSQLRAFQLADELAVQVYQATTCFPKHEQFGLTNPHFSPCRLIVADLGWLGLGGLISCLVWGRGGLRRSSTGRNDDFTIDGAYRERCRRALSFEMDDADGQLGTGRCGRRRRFAQTCANRLRHG